MIRINLLPHREERRKQRQKDFVALMLLSGIFGALMKELRACCSESCEEK